MHDILHTVEKSTVKSVLATIIHVEGSSYLKEGTSMLFQENGENIGMLSAGCVEADLAERVKELFDTEHVLTVTYNLKEEGDAGWGQGAVQWNSLYSPRACNCEDEARSFAGKTPFR